MSEGPAETGGQGGNVQPQETQQVDNSQRAPYADYLDKIPESLRPSVEPVFKEWDANYTRTTQDYSQKLDRYTPYEQIISQVPDPQALEYAVQVAATMQNDPEQLFNMLAQHLGYELDDENDMTGDEEGQQDARYQALESGLSDLTELIQNQQEEQQEQQQASEILDYLNGVEQQRGEMDYELVLGWAADTGNLDQAVEKYYQKFGPVLQRQQQKPPAPLSGNGGLPSEQKELSALTPKERNALIVQTLNAANQAAQQ